MGVRDGAPALLMFVGAGGLLVGAIVPAAHGSAPIVSEAMGQFLILAMAAAVALKYDSDRRRGAGDD